MFTKKRYIVIFILLFLTPICAICEDDQDVQRLFESARTAYKNKDYDRAIRKFNNIAFNFAASKLADDALFQMAMCYKEKGSFEDAIKWLGLIIQMYPHSDSAPKAAFTAGRLYEEKKQYREATAYYTYLINNCPDSKEVPYACYVIPLFSYYSLTKETETIPALNQIIKGLNEALKKYPEHEKAKEAKVAIEDSNIKVIDIYLREDRYAEARRYCEEFIKEFPNASRIDYLRYRIAYTYNMEQSFDKAMQLYKDFLEKYPKSHYADDACERIASIYSGFLDNRAEAIRYFEIMRDRYPKEDQTIRGIWILAALYTEAKEYRKAIGAYQWLLVVDPKSDGANKARVKIQEIEGKLQEK